MSRKRYSDGHFLRRLRRMLERNGLEPELSFRQRPAYPTCMPERILESRIVKDGVLHVMHHSIAVPLTQDDIDRIHWQLPVHRPGIPQEEIDEYADSWGTALMTGEGMYPLADSGFGTGSSITVPVLLVDILRRPHQMGMRYASADRRQDKEWDTLHRRVDGSRRDAKGRVKPVLVGGLLATYLRSHPRGAAIAASLMPRLEQSLDGHKLHDGMSRVTVDTVVTGDEAAGLRWRIKGQNILIDSHDIPGAHLDGNTMVIRGAFPESVAQAAIGRRLGEIVEGLPFDPDITIRSARVRRAPWSGLSIVLDVPSTTPDDLIEELS